MPVQLFPVNRIPPAARAKPQSTMNAQPKQAEEGAKMIRPAFQNRFYAGVLAILVLGIYLFQLWQPDRQVHLHSTHLATALEENDWAEVASFLAEDYRDQWGHDRATLLTNLRQVLHYARNLRIDAQRTITSASGREGSWSSRIAIAAEDNEVATMIKARINVLEEPFELSWRRESWKPWDWKLVRVRNPALELPSGMF